MNDDPSNDPRFNKQEVENARHEMVLSRLKGLLKSEDATHTKFEQDAMGQEYFETSLEVNSLGNDALSRINRGKLSISYVPVTPAEFGGETTEDATIPEILTVDVFTPDLTLINRYTLSRDQEGSPFITVGDDEYGDPVHPATQEEELELQSMIEAAKTMVSPPAETE